jgi:hypothetical protein
MNRLELESLVEQRREAVGRSFENTHSMDECIERLAQKSDDPQPPPIYLTREEQRLWRAITSLYFFQDQVSLERFATICEYWKLAMCDPNWPSVDFYIKNAAPSNA